MPLTVSPSPKGGWQVMDGDELITRTFNEATARAFASGETGLPVRPKPKEIPHV